VRWIVHGERTIYDSPWIRLALTDVEIPGSTRFEHHVVRAPQPASGVVVVDPDRGVLLLWRHRFTTDTWGWEIPIGGIEPGERPDQAARREVEEETGWRPTSSMTPLVYTQPSPGLMTAEHHVFQTESAEYIGEPEDGFESERVEWVPLGDIRTLIAKGDISAGTSLVALLLLVAERT